VSTRRHDFPPNGMHGNPKDGFCPPCGSAAPHASYVSGPAGRPSSTATMTACQAVRASPDSGRMAAGQAFGMEGVRCVRFSDAETLQGLKSFRRGEVGSRCPRTARTFVATPHLLVSGLLGGMDKP
jgi:hypothetical protein